jgi:wobble nucleotide-excising tRNase
VKDIRLLNGAAVLADRKPGDPSLELVRYNLFYGFNGSGKSTLARIFATLQLGKKRGSLPEGCSFEIEMSDGKRFASSAASTAQEKRVCVFNDDFISENLRWEAGLANPVFYIGAGQAEAADRLKALEGDLPLAEANRTSHAKVLNEREKAFNEYKRVIARNIAERLRQPGRYEAPQLASDVERFFRSGGAALGAAELDAAIATCARSEPPPKVSRLAVPLSAVQQILDLALELAPKSIGTIVVDGLDAHPQMVAWARQGHEYHVEHSLKSCLYCAGEISDERASMLAAAFDDKLSKFVVELNTAAHHAGTVHEAFAVAKAAVPAAAQLSNELQPAFEASAAAFVAALADVTLLLKAASDALGQRKRMPTTVIQVSLPSADEVRARLKALGESCDSVNAICQQHDDMVEDFNQHQLNARENIRQHFAAISAGEYATHVDSISEAKTKSGDAEAALEKLNVAIAALRSQVQQHGSAAEKINALVKSYLGHGELTIVAVPAGYELHRHGKLVTGEPSEGKDCHSPLLFPIDARG